MSVETIGLYIPNIVCILAVTTPSVHATSGNKTISILTSPPYYYNNQSGVGEREEEWKAHENTDYVDCTRIILDRAEREHRQLQFEYLWWPR